jgi:hypothetical protein
MAALEWKLELADAVMSVAASQAKVLGRAKPNIEDQLRAALQLVGGLRVEASDPTRGPSAASLMTEWEGVIAKTLADLRLSILETEGGIRKALEDGADPKRANEVRRLAASFLLAFASRTPSRDRLHIFTTNYDRVMEFACDLVGIRVLDRFVGSLEPVFTSSRLGVDIHYNPPGIRGEPRYLEGVVRLSKLHGSLDWYSEIGPNGLREVVRRPLPFGARVDARTADTGSLLVYPNAAKDAETLEYPYADLFRDFAAALCRPNAVVVTYGYGYGDDHVNRVLRDMLTIPSTHLVIISRSLADGRIPTFVDRVARDEQMTLLIGPLAGDLRLLVQHYLPKPAIDRNTWRMVELLERRMGPGHYRISGESKDEKIAPAAGEQAT